MLKGKQEITRQSVQRGLSVQAEMPRPNYVHQDPIAPLQVYLLQYSVLLEHTEQPAGSLPVDVLGNVLQDTIARQGLLILL